MYIYIYIYVYIHTPCNYNRNYPDTRKSQLATVVHGNPPHRDGSIHPVGTAAHSRPDSGVVGPRVVEWLTRGHVSWTLVQRQDVETSPRARRPPSAYRRNVVVRQSNERVPVWQTAYDYQSTGRSWSCRHCSGSLRRRRRVLPSPNGDGARTRVVTSRIPVAINRTRLSIRTRRCR